MRLFPGIVASITWSFAITSVKGSFAFLYMRFLSHTGRHWVVPLNITVLIFLACQAIEVSVVIFQCVPIESQRRTDIEGASYGLAPMWICDALCVQPCNGPCTAPAAYPRHLEPEIHVNGEESRHHRYALAGTTVSARLLASIPRPQCRIVFADQTILLAWDHSICIISIIRLFAVLKLIRGDDDAYERAIAIIWCQVEAGTLIICSCVPHLHQVAFRIEPIRKLLNLEASSHRTLGQGVVTKSAERWRSRIKKL
ncbi:hypothetical protein, variant [Gaeumannomyces tritici R3-111a-1]|nr:hypothetical protein, variant [Gaeumannomyces tritici R3-111a-1]EJT72135.1 hypothetical protein, variant [Gaeumannomyces tritici R3-111a-1]